MHLCMRAWTFVCAHRSARMHLGKRNSLKRRRARIFHCMVLRMCLFIRMQDVRLCARASSYAHTHLRASAARASSRKHLSLCACVCVYACEYIYASCARMSVSLLVSVSVVACVCARARVRIVKDRRVHGGTCILCPHVGARWRRSHVGRVVRNNASDGAEKHAHAHAYAHACPQSQCTHRAQERA